MAKIYPAIIKQQVADGYAKNILKKAAQDRVESVVYDAQQRMLEEFDNDPVTKEIQGGINSSNISQTLGGGPAPKNLYSFIGFDEDNPTAPVREILESNDKNGVDIKFIGKDPSNPLIYKFGVTAPSLEKIYQATPIPWATQLSWAQKIETTIPGFAQFFASFKFDSPEPSRSGGGIQDKKKKFSGEFVGVKYLSKIIGNFINSLNNFGKGGYRIKYKK